MIKKVGILFLLISGLGMVGRIIADTFNEQPHWVIIGVALLAIHYAIEQIKSRL